MREERRLTEWLADYRDSLDGLAPAARLEGKLREEVKKRRRVAVAPWLLASGAAAVLALGIWIGGRTRAVPPAPIPAATSITRVPPQLVEVEPVGEPAAVTVRPPALARTRLVTPPMSPPRPSAVFVMLPGSELMPPAQDLQVLRVRIPRTRIQSMGLPVNVDRLEERVLADIVIGEDGVARAVRLVPAEQ